MLETMDHQVLKVLLVRQEKLAQMEQMDPKARREVLAQKGTKEPGAQWETKVLWERPVLLAPRVERDGWALWDSRDRMVNWVLQVAQEIQGPMGNLA